MSANGRPWGDFQARESTNFLNRVLLVTVILSFTAFSSPAIATSAYTNGASGYAIYVWGTNAVENITSINASISNASFLQDMGNKYWLLKVPLIVNDSQTTLSITGLDTSWLKLQSLNDSNVAYLKIQGKSIINNTKITSWNTTTGVVAPSTDVNRSYVYVTGSGAKINITNSNVSYLGYNDIIGYTNNGLNFAISTTANIVNSTLSNNYIGIYIANAIVTISNSTIIQSSRHGILINSLSANPIIVQNSIISNNSLSGIYTNAIGNSNLQILSNNIINNSQFGIQIFGQSQNVWIENNTVSYSGSSGIGIYSVNNSFTNNLTVIRNVIENNSGSNLDARYTENSTISYNTIVGSQYDDGLVIENNSDNNIITGNSIHDNHKFGIYLGIYSNGNVFRDNYISNTNLSNQQVEPLTDIANGEAWPVWNNTFQNTTSNPTLYPWIGNPGSNMTLIYPNIFSVRQWNDSNIFKPIQAYPTNNSVFLGYNSNTDKNDNLYAVNTYNASIIPSSDFVNITVSVWNTTSDYYKKWNESSANHSVTTLHTIGDFPANTGVIINKNGAYWNTFTSNSSGYINFTYSEGYSNIQFEAQQDTTAPTVSLSLSTTSIYQASTSSSSGMQENAQIITVISNDVVEKIIVNLNAQISGASVTIAKMESIPASIPPMIEPIYQYFNITENNFSNSQIKNASIDFKVNKSWINGNNIINVSLARYENGWNKLKTELINQTSSQNIYRAYADGFSYFAIVGEKRTEQTNAIQQNKTAENDKVPTITEPVNAPLYKLSIVIVLIAVLLLIYGAYAKRNRVKVKRGAK